ncbi:MAG: flagellar hook capping FlgD N-terminal domain-containing protein [Oscillospiraceae bacterium]
MSVSSVSSTDSIDFVGSTSTENSSGISVDTDTFLQLLVAQLQYQDPLEPQTDTAFVTQLAQMTSLEQMQQMNSSLANSQAYDMIGKNVYAETVDEDTGITYSYFGPVDSVVIKNSTPYVVIGGTAISVSNVQQIFDDSLFETSSEETSEETSEAASEKTSDTDSEDDAGIV